MVKGKYAYYVLGIVIVAALLLKAVSFFDSKPGQDSGNNNDKDGFILEGDKNPSSTPPVVDKDDKPVNSNQEVILEHPQPGQVVSSPLTVSGKAKGPWFFEASLPIRLLDDKGQTIAVVPAQAEGEWMTENLVPFKAVLDFQTSATSGYLVVSKDNPSGLPENDASVRISVRFSNK